jgi:hypothetical protein
MPVKAPVIRTTGVVICSFSWSEISLKSLARRVIPTKGLGDSGVLLLVKLRVM